MLTGGRWNSKNIQRGSLTCSKAALSFRAFREPVAFVAKSKTSPAMIHSLWIVISAVLFPPVAAERSSPTETFPFDPSKWTLVNPIIKQWLAFSDAWGSRQKGLYGKNTMIRRVPQRGWWSPSASLVMWHQLRLTETRLTIDEQEISRWALRQPRHHPTIPPSWHEVGKQPTASLSRHVTVTEGLLVFQEHSEGSENAQLGEAGEHVGSVLKQMDSAACTNQLTKVM